MAGTISRGIKAPIIREGDDVVKIVADAVLKAVEEDGFQLHDRDVVAVTEAVVARADGNYCTVDDISADVREKLGDTVGVVFPIMSRNRFAICLRGIARGAKRIETTEKDKKAAGQFLPRQNGLWDKDMSCVSA